MPDDDFGPVLVTVEYQVAPEQDEEFLKAVRQYRRIRRRDGARRWGIFHDMENGHRYVETFIVASLGRTSPATRTIHDGGSRDRGASAAMCHIRAESPAPSFGRVGRVLFH
jgi:hypothetical protein